MRQETSARGRSTPFLARPAAAILYATAVLIVGAAAVRQLWRAHADRALLETGRAEWIWYGSGAREPQPIRFFATRDVVLPRPVARATAKIFVDREHVLWVNGARAGSGSQRPGDPLALHDITSLLRAGTNRIGIEAASPTGIGGLLFALDLSEGGRDAVVSDVRWRVDLSPEALASGGRYRPLVWGRPPMHPWGYPRMPRPNEP